MNMMKQANAWEKAMPHSETGNFITDYRVKSKLRIPFKIQAKSFSEIAVIATACYLNISSSFIKGTISFFGIAKVCPVFISPVVRILWNKFIFQSDIYKWIPPVILIVQFL